MRAATLFVYWVMTIVTVLAILAIPTCLGIAIWTEEGRWGWTALLCGCSAFLTAFIAAALEE